MEASPVAWWVGMPGAALVGIVVVLGPVLGKIIEAWIARRKGEENAPTKQVTGESSVLRAIIQDLVVRMREHAETDTDQAKEIKDELHRLQDAVGRIERRLAGFFRKPSDSG